MVLGTQSHGGKDVDAFFDTLAAGLERLEASMQQDFVRCDWVQQAVDLLRSLHAEVLALVDKLQLPVPGRSLGTGGAAGGRRQQQQQQGQGQGQEWVESYMEETVKLLEVCNVLKAGIAGLDQYHMLVEVGVRALDSANLKSHCHRCLHALNACKDEAVRLAAEHRNLLDTKIEADGKLLLSLNEKHVDHKCGRWGGFWGVMFAVKNVNAFLGRLLLWVLVYAGAGDRPPFAVQAVSLKSAWCMSLQRLSELVNEEMGRKVRAKRSFLTFFHDFELLHHCTLALILQLQPLTRGPSVLAPADTDKLKLAVQQLKDNSAALHTSLDTLEWHINDLFDEVVDGRTKLLALLTNVLS